MGEQTVKVPVSKNYYHNIKYLNRELGVDKSFDVIHIEYEYGKRRMSLYLVDGFAKDESITQIQRELAKLTEEDLREDPLNTVLKSNIPYIELDTSQDLDEIVNEVLAGPAALVIEDVDTVILMDTRTYPVRGLEEPDTEQVIRGAKDGFVETLIFNAALIRRRIRDRTLRVEYIRVGKRSRSDLSLVYVEDIADPEIMNKIRSALDKINTDGLPMGDKTIEEFVFGQHWNPYPLVRYTERPDVAASHLLEGHVIIMVDGSPSVMITPTSFWHHLQHAEEYRQKPIIGAGMRFVRFAAVWASIFLLPLWYLLASKPELLQENINFIGVTEMGKVPLIAQFLIAEVGIEMMRMAAIHTPAALATALGLVAAILIGEVAIQVGLFTHEVILYLAVAAVGTFSTPSYEMSLANRVVRVFLLVATAIFDVTGFVVATLLWVLYLARMKAINTPYLWPFLPFSYRGFRDVLVRSPIPLKNRRPQAIHPQDVDR